MKKSFSIYYALTLLCAFTFFGCAQTKPVSEAMITQYGLDGNPEAFKQFQYFVSRDFVLDSTTTTSQKGTTDTGTAQIDTVKERNANQFLASTPGIVTKVEDPLNKGDFKLRVRFEEGAGKFLWFAKDPRFGKSSYFYLVYTNAARREVEYGNKIYIVSYEGAEGLQAAFQRATTVNRDEGDYLGLPPLLLYEEIGTFTEKENVNTVKGVKFGGTFIDED